MKNNFKFITVIMVILCIFCSSITAFAEPIEEQSFDKKPQTQAEKTTEKKPEKTTEKKPEKTYILNLNTKKFHYPACSAVNKISEENKEVFKGDKNELIYGGYFPCGICNP